MLSASKQTTTPGGRKGSVVLITFYSLQILGIEWWPPMLVTGNNLREDMFELQRENISCDLWFLVCEPN